MCIVVVDMNCICLFVIFANIIVFIWGGLIICYRMTVTRQDEYGVEETVTEILPGKSFVDVLNVLCNVLMC